MLSPQGALESQCKSLGCLDFDAFKNHLRKWHKEGIYIIDQDLNPSEWSSFDDIPPKQAREMLKFAKSQL